MPAPDPIFDEIPDPINISQTAHAAILGDTTVSYPVRTAVLIQLEKTIDPKEKFFEFCDCEGLRGLQVNLSDLGQLGHAILLSKIAEGIQLGWFGNEEIADPVAVRGQIEDLKHLLKTNKSSEAALQYINSLYNFDQEISDHVTWFFFDSDNYTNPLELANYDLADRLALPDIVNSKNSAEFLVFAIPVNKFSETRLPRFYDAGSLDVLEFWRPGGKTAPISPILEHLYEIVSKPLPLFKIAAGLKLVDCLPPQMLGQSTSNANG